MNVQFKSANKLLEAIAKILSSENAPFRMSECVELVDGFVDRVKDGLSIASCER